jgi:hypothetical protein
MRLRTKVEQFGLVTESETSANVTHSQKRTFKGAKIARVQSITESAQAERIDAKLSWEAQRKRRKEERQRRRGI